MVRCELRVIVLLAAATCFGRAADGAEALDVAFAACDVTPDLSSGRPVWLAGYAPGRQATGVHDPLFARCVLLRHGGKKLALVSIDLVGIQYPVVQRIRQRLPGFAYVMVSSTHNHEGPDVIGAWGKSFFQRGVDDTYVDLVVDRTVRMIEAAERSLTPSVARYGIAQDESLLNDSREPDVRDGVIRVLRFCSPSAERPLGLLVQWNCHPEALGADNTQITADFPAATIAALQQRWNCPVAYFSGALGGLMAPPRNRIHDEQGRPLGTGDFEFARRYGIAVAGLADKAIERAAPIELTPFVISARPILVPVENTLYRLARVMGVLRRQGYIWTGDFERPGGAATMDSADQTTGIETEVAYLRLGELDVACIPGELYPELVHGKVQDPVDPGADFPDAPAEPAVAATLPGKRWLLFGMANDEIGYIIPRRQWDQRPPFAYGRATAQYGEINSCGPQVAPIVMEALVRRVGDAKVAEKVSP